MANETTININEILGRFTWGNVLKLDPCNDGIEFAESVLGLKSGTRLTGEHLARIRTYSPPWADWVLYRIGSDLPELSTEERFELFRDLKEDYRRYAAARHALGLNGNQRFELVNSMGYSYWRKEAANYVPDLTMEQREILRTTHRMEDTQTISDVLV